MTRRILCEQCGVNYTLHREDVARGFRMRSQWIVSTGVPSGHGLTVNNEFSPMEDIHCDFCDKVVTHQRVIAVTIWLQSKEAEPKNWEKDYGSPLPMQAVMVAKALEKNQQ